MRAFADREVQNTRVVVLDPRAPLSADRLALRIELALTYKLRGRDRAPAIR